MSKFRCGFHNFDCESVYKINVKRVENGVNEEIEESGEIDNLNPKGEPRIIVYSTKMKDDNEVIVKMYFKTNDSKSILAYLRLLMRTHMQENFGINMEHIIINHIGGKLYISDLPDLKYLDKVEYYRMKRYALQQLIKDKKDNMNIYSLLNKLDVVNKKYGKVCLKHSIDVKEKRYSYINRIIDETSLIFEDLLVLISDAHDFSLTEIG